MDFLFYASTRPDTYRVERSTKIEAPATVVFSQLEDFKAWGTWSPWDKLDPAMKKTYAGPPKGVGAIYSWEGNKKVGKGRMAITDAKPPTSIAYRLEFIEPFAAVANTSFKLAPEGDKATNVTWAMEGTNNLIGKAWGVFMNMDKAIGADFEKGLSRTQDGLRGRGQEAGRCGRRGGQGRGGSGRRRRSQGARPQPKPPTPNANAPPAASGERETEKPPED